MRIALLTLPVDENIGGHLQRYALMTVLQNMGHDVTHINLRYNFDNESWLQKCWFHVRDILVKIKKRQKLFPLQKTRGDLTQLDYEQECKQADKFYERYIHHTEVINSKKGLYKLSGYDCYIVGSDQVWRKQMTRHFGLLTFFFVFLNPAAKRIAYGISFGTADNELDETEIYELGQLYKRFAAVSVRENSALDLLRHYRWNSPKPIHVLDPTMLLEETWYANLTKEFEGKEQFAKGQYIASYIFDKSEKNMQRVKENEERLQMKSIYLPTDGQMEIEEWLSAMYNAAYVVTDSFHGVVFSILFQKPFCFLKNDFRGNERVDSLARMLQIDLTKEEQNWAVVEERLNEYRNQSMKFLESNLHVH